MKKLVLALLALVLAAALGMVTYVGWLLYPQQDPRPLPQQLVALDSEEGRLRLDRATAAADYPALAAAFQPQALVSYCGVATSVTVLDALGTDTSQWSFFSTEANRVRSRMQVTFGGMSLPEFSGLLRSHGPSAVMIHASEASVESFRAAVRRNLSAPNDYLVVNYQREALGQDRVGHISPVAAYDPVSDSVLIMDTAAHKYPPTWAPLPQLFQAMNTTDPASGLSRGYVEIRQDGQEVPDPASLLEALAEMMDGTFETSLPEPFRDRRQRIEAPRLGQAVFYLQLNQGAELDLYRQRVLVLTPTPEGDAVVQRAYRLIEPELWVDAGPGQFTDLAPDQVHHAMEPGCEMTWRRVPTGFQGYTDPEQCRIISSRTGKPRRIESENRLMRDALWLAERGFDPQGQQLFGTEPGDFYRLERRQD